MNVLMLLVIGVVAFLATYMGLSALDVAVVTFVGLGAIVALCIYTDEGDDDE